MVYCLLHKTHSTSLIVSCLIKGRPFTILDTLTCFTSNINVSYVLWLTKSTIFVCFSGTKKKDFCAFRQNDHFVEIFFRGSRTRYPNDQGFTLKNKCFRRKTTIKNSVFYLPRKVEYLLIRIPVATGNLIPHSMCDKLRLLYIIYHNSVLL